MTFDVAKLAHHAEAEGEGGEGGEGGSKSGQELGDGGRRAGGEGEVAENAEQGHGDHGVGDQTPGDAAEGGEDALLLLPSAKLEQDEADGVEDEERDGGDQVEKSH